MADLPQTVNRFCMVHKHQCTFILGHTCTPRHSYDSKGDMEGLVFRLKTLTYHNVLFVEIDIKYKLWKWKAFR